MKAFTKDNYKHARLDDATFSPVSEIKPVVVIHGRPQSPEEHLRFLAAFDLLLLEMARQQFSTRTNNGL